MMRVASASRTPISQLVLNCFPENERSHVALSEFAGLLQLFLQSSTLRGRFDHYFLLLRWLEQRDGNIPLPSGDDAATKSAHTSRWRRAHVLRVVIVQSAQLRELYVVVLGEMVAQTSCVSLFAEAGLPHERGFLGEAVARTMRYVIPAPRNDADLEQQLRRLYKNPRNARQFTQAPLEMFHEIVEAFSLSSQREIWTPSVSALREALVLLAARVQGLGLGRELRERGSFEQVSNSPFFKLARCTDRLINALTLEQKPAPAEQAWHEDVQACRAEMREITRKLDETGISVSIVFSIETIEKCLMRMEPIVKVLTLPDGLPRSKAIHRLISLSINATFEDKSLRRLVASNLHLLSKKIVERTGRTGGHYIAGNLNEYWHMWMAAAGGGILTVATATFKMQIFALHLAPLIEGLAGGFNYAVSFIFLLVLGLALATKQPAMTGATLAGILREHSGTDRLDRIVDTFMLICRTQIATALGNILLVSIGCVVLGHFWQLVFKIPILTLHEAQHVYESLNPFDSGTVFFAALTGVILWFSSLAGGWIENWSVCNKLPQGIADHKLGERLGAGRMRSLARFWENNVASWGGSIVLGFMLGMTPEIGRFTGIPLDVRHVTLSTGTLALAVSAMGSGWLNEGLFIKAAVGIGVMFVLNLSVSFLLAFATAIRAYELSFRELIQLAGMALKRMLSRPWEFLLPIGWPKQDINKTDLHIPGDENARRE